VSALPANIPGNTELRHGYTLSQVSALSVFAVRRQLWHQAADFDERLEIAWHAIVEHIYAADEPPQIRDVIRAGFKAIGREADKTRRFYGQDTHDRYAGTTGGFERYWWFAGRPAPGPEDKVTERLALAQIWPRLRPLHRQVLVALAADDDYELAAKSLGKSRKTFTTQVSQARRAFLALWHEGEAPSRPWGVDRRIGDTDRHTITNRAIRRRRAAVRYAQQDRPPRPAATTRRADLGVPDAELVRRYEAGESIRQLATTLGCSYSVIQRRLNAEGAQLRSMGRPVKPAASTDLGGQRAELDDRA
jgi:Helix-turn-helix domain